MEVKDNIIDFGSISLPKSWNDITLKQYQEIERYYSDTNKPFDVRDVLTILTPLSQDDINAMPLEFLDKILVSLVFLNEELPKDKPTNWVEIDGEKYQVNIQEKLKTGEYIATDAVIKSDSHNYAAILAVLCRKEGELFNSKFENEELEKRIELFEKQPITKVKPIMDFFLQCYVTSHHHTLLSSLVKEQIDLTRKHIDTSRKNGGLSILSTKRLMRKLRKLQKSINFT